MSDVVVALAGREVETFQRLLVDRARVLDCHVMVQPAVVRAEETTKAALILSPEGWWDEGPSVSLPVIRVHLHDVLCLVSPA